MLDIQFIRENPELVAEKSRQKGYEVDVEKLLELDERRRNLQQNLETINNKRNVLANLSRTGAVGDKKEFEEQFKQRIEDGRKLKDERDKAEEQLKAAEEEFSRLLKAIPNMPLEDVPVGATEDQNMVAKTVGELPKFDFAPKNHWEILGPRDMLDKERAAKVSGSRFAYLKGDLVRLQFAIVQFVLETLGDEAVIARLVKENGLHVSSKPFTPVLPPAMLRTEPYVASARLNAEEVTYRAGQPDDDLWLNASAEHTLCTMYWNEILPGEMLPVRYVGYSTSFRREAGTYGKDTEGIIRMHQFDKLEMEVFSTAATGHEEHKLLIAIQEYLVQQLGLPYRYLRKCTADIGKPNASGVDIDCWFPGEGKYRETHTADYMTDYQARDLRIRTRRKNGETELVHTNDATAFAMGRIMAAVVENYQQADGSVRVPEVLRPYMGGREKL